MKKKKKKGKKYNYCREKKFSTVSVRNSFFGGLHFFRIGENFLQVSSAQCNNSLSPVIIQLNVISVHVTQFKYLRERMYEQINK